MSIQVALTIAHIGAGTVALIVAPIAMAVRKGGEAHRIWGWVFSWAMLVLCASALGMLVFNPSIFLSLFSFYAVFSGVRALRRKRPERGQRATRLDFLGAAAALLAGLSFIAWGVLPLLPFTQSEVPVSFSLLGIVFGYFLTRMAWTDVRSFVTPDRDRNWWWYYHMERMLAGYIAAFTAFTVQNVGPMLPEELQWTVWLAPGIVGGRLTQWWTEHYRYKFADRAKEGRKAVYSGVTAEK